MSHSDVIRLVSSQPQPDHGASRRYRVVVSDSQGPRPAIRVYDRGLARVLVKWTGDTAGRLLESGTFTRLLRGRQDCDKQMVRKLTLAAAAMDMAPARSVRTTDRLRQRLENLDAQISSQHARVAEVLFDYPEHHFSREDVICLLGLRRLCFDRKRIEACLDDLVSWRVVQRVEVDVDTVFFDINTEPHLHLFCPQRRELTDAPSSGVVHARRTSG